MGLEFCPLLLLLGKGKSVSSCNYSLKNIFSYCSFNHSLEKQNYMHECAHTQAHNYGKMYPVALSVKLII